MKQLPSILIVDDSVENLMLLQAVLGSMRINLISASSGSEALEKTEGTILALAIIDVHMPLINGYELAIRLNEVRALDKVPVIFLTANYFDEIELLKGYKAGAVDYIYKPVNYQILLSKSKIFLDLFFQKQSISNYAGLLKQYADKLKKSNATLLKSEEKYRSYVENDPDGVFLVDKNGKYIEVNEAACTITGYEKEELIGMFIQDMFLQESYDSGMGFIDKVRKTGVSNFEAVFKRKNGTSQWLTIDAVRLSEEQFLGYVKDITERKLAEEALKESEHRFRSFFELTADMVAIADIDGYFTDINSSWTNVLGYSIKELMGRPFIEFVHSQDIEKTKSIIKEKIQKGETVLSFENRYVKKDGGIVWLEWNSQPQMQKGVSFSIARDITERKKAEEKLQNSLDQLHQLTQYIEQVRENERVAISRELHDDLGQSLTAVKIELGLIKKKVFDSEALVRIDKVAFLVSETIKTVQRLTSQLRPQILEDLGLEAAIEWHLKEFSERNGVEYLLDLDEDTSIYISPGASLIVFRIMQESLTNIARHSKATRAEIRLVIVDNQIDFRILDNGIGITEPEINSSKSFGLIGMKERAASIGGSLEIRQIIGTGTEIVLKIPVNS